MRLNLYLFIFYIVENARHETVFMELLHQYVKISILYYSSVCKNKYFQFIIILVWQIILSAGNNFISYLSYLIQIIIKLFVNLESFSK